MTPLPHQYPNTVAIIKSTTHTSTTPHSNTLPHNKHVLDMTPSHLSYMTQSTLYRRHWFVDESPERSGFHHKRSCTETPYLEPICARSSLHKSPNVARLHACVDATCNLNSVSVCYIIARVRACTCVQMCAWGDRSSSRRIHASFDAICTSAILAGQTIS